MRNTPTPMDTRTVYGRPGMATAVENDTEWALIAHVRGHCHDSTACQLCKALDTEFRARSMARSEELRRIDAEIAHAYTARELLRTQETLNSIIEG